MRTTRQFFVYMLSNRTRRLYVGVTGDLTRRIWQHQQGLISGFTTRYSIVRLVYYEVTQDPRTAITREKQVKGWLRRRKIELIETANPEWRDLSDGWFG